MHPLILPNPARSFQENPPSWSHPARSAYLSRVNCTGLQPGLSDCIAVRDILHHKFVDRKMKFRISLLAALALALTAGAALDAEPARAQVPKVTAGEVVDRESLKGFVTWATSEFAAITNISDGARVL